MKDFQKACDIVAETFDCVLEGNITSYFYDADDEELDPEHKEGEVSGYYAELTFKPNEVRDTSIEDITPLEHLKEGWSMSISSSYRYSVYLDSPEFRLSCRGSGDTIEEAIEKLKGKIQENLHKTARQHFTLKSVLP